MIDDNASSAIPTHLEARLLRVLEDIDNGLNDRARREILSIVGMSEYKFLNGRVKLVLKAGLSSREMDEVWRQMQTALRLKLTELQAQRDEEGEG